MKPVKMALLTATCIAAAGIGFTAHAGYLSGNRELAGVFCGDMDNPDAYKKSGMEHYAFLIKGRDGWIFRTENDFRKEWGVNDKTAGYLLSLQNAFRKNNAELVIVMPPTRGMVHADKLSKNQKKEYGLTNPDIVWNEYESALGALQKKGVQIIGIKRNEISQNFFYKRNHHWSAEGARITAEKIASIVKHMKIYQKIPQKTYTSMQGKPAPYESSFEKAFKKICKTQLPPEPALHYETSGKNEIADSNSLFTEGTQPQVYLLGTSNSLSDSSGANFDGFLKENLSADVMNLSYAGAGIDTSIMSFLNSSHFSDGKAKIVIWEVPGYYDFNVMDDKLFNQIIPASFGKCENRPVDRRILKITTPGQTILWDIGAPEVSEGLQPISFSKAGSLSNYDLSKLYLHLSFSEPVKEKFSLKFQFEDGGTKRQDFVRAEAYPADGDFYTLFPASNKQLKRISIVTEHSLADVNLDVQICQAPNQN